MHNLRKLRKEKHYTLRDVANVIDSPKEYIYQLEKGIRPLKPEVGEKIANFFQVPIDVLYGEDSIRMAKYLYTTLQNIVLMFKQKGIEYDNYQKTNFEKELYYYDKLIYPILEHITTPQKINIQDFRIIKELVEMLALNNDFNNVSKYNKPAGEILNKKIDTIVELVNKYKIKSDKE